jgi:hypothetical protein
LDCRPPIDADLPQREPGVLYRYGVGVITAIR